MPDHPHALEPSRLVRNAVINRDPALIQNEKLLPERQLAEHLGIGRRKLRALLAQLESEGLLFRRQGQGTFVREVSTRTTSLDSLTNDTSPIDVMEVRRVIEPALARLAAERATLQDIAQMRRFIRNAELAARPEDYEKWDSAFHTKLAESVRNKLFGGVFRITNAVRKEQSWIATRSRVFSEGVSAEMVLLHRNIVDAIERRDADGAEAAMRDHLNMIRMAQPATPTE